MNVYTYVCAIQFKLYSKLFIIQLKCKPMPALQSIHNDVKM